MEGDDGTQGTPPFAIHGNGDDGDAEDSVSGDSGDVAAFPVQLSLENDLTVELAELADEDGDRYPPLTDGGSVDAALWNASIHPTRRTGTSVMVNNILWNVPAGLWNAPSRDHPRIRKAIEAVQSAVYFERQTAHESGTREGTYYSATLSSPNHRFQPQVVRYPW